MAIATRKNDDGMEEFMLRMGRAAYCDNEKSKVLKTNMKKNTHRSNRKTGRNKTASN